MVACARLLLRPPCHHHCRRATTTAAAATTTPTTPTTTTIALRACLDSRSSHVASCICNRTQVTSDDKPREEVKILSIDID
jgi:hypothetical protein